MASWKKVIVSGSNLSQLNNDAGYLTSATVGNFVSGSSDSARTNLNSITGDELSQLLNINSVTISNTQWGYLGAQNQGVATTDSVQFADVTASLQGNVVGNVTGDVTGNVTAATGSSTFNNVTVNGTLDVTGTTIANVTDPVLAQDAATKNYVDTNDALKLNLSGGTMSGDINMGTLNKVTNLAAPTATADAATKGYVDTQVNSSDIAFAMDATGLSNTDIRNYLNTMFPTNVSGRICRVLATTYAFAALTDVEAAKTITPVSVDRNGQLEFEAVVKNVVFTDATTTVTMTPSRTIKTFAWDGTTWRFQA